MPVLRERPERFPQLTCYRGAIRQLVSLAGPFRGLTAEYGRHDLLHHVNPAS
jgi:hypothetical protein